MRCDGVVSSVFSLFCYVLIGEKFIIFVLSQQEGCKCNLSAYSASFLFMAQPSNMDSHNHVIGLMGSAFNEGVLLDIDH